MAQRPGSFINNAVDMQPLNPALLSEEQLAPELEAIQEEFEIEIDDDDVTEDDFGDLEVVEEAFSDNLAEAIAMEDQ